MKKIRVLLAALIATLVGIGAMSFQSTPESLESVKSQDDVLWYFHGDSEGDLDNILLWQREDLGGPHGNCVNTGTLPCAIPGSANPSEFEAKIGDMDPGDFLDEAIGDRD